MKSPFLIYHKIDSPTADVKIRGGFTKPARFERQVRYLKRNGIGFMTASAMIEYFRDRGCFPQRTVSITFDDGWKDNYTNAFPIMKKYGITATIFLVPSVLGKITAQIAADGEGPREHMSAHDVREMAAAGIEFGSHTIDHKLLDRIDPDEARRQIYESKTLVADVSGKDCAVLAYPAGFFTDAAADAARDAGYVAAFTTVYGNDDGSDLYRLNRTEILRRDGYPFQFGRKIATVLGR